MTVRAHVDQQLFSVKTSHKIYIKDRRSDRCDRWGTYRPASVFMYSQFQYLERD